MYFNFFFFLLLQTIRKKSGNHNQLKTVTVIRKQLLVNEDKGDIHGTLSNTTIGKFSLHFILKRLTSQVTADKRQEKGSVFSCP